MKITKEQLVLLVEKTVKRALNEAPKATSENLMKVLADAQNLTPQEIGSLISQLKKMQTQKVGAGASDVESAQKVGAFYDALNSFMSAWDWEGPESANHRLVSSRLKKLEAYDPAIAGQVAPLWQELLVQVKNSVATNKKLYSLSSFDPEHQKLDAASMKAWKNAQKLEDQILKIIRPILNAHKL